MKQKGKRIALWVTVILTIGSMSMPVFANAREVTDMDASQPVVVQTPESENTDSPSAETPQANPVEEIAGTGNAEETSNPEISESVEAPKGNLTMVEEVIDTNGARKQFVTLATKNGNFFYLIKNVFLPFGRFLFSLIETSSGVVNMYLLSTLSLSSKIS